MQMEEQNVTRCSINSPIRKSHITSGHILGRGQAGKLFFVMRARIYFAINYSDNNFKFSRVKSLHVRVYVCNCIEDKLFYTFRYIA